MASSFLPKKSIGRAVFSSTVCEDMVGGAGGTRGTEPVTGGGFLGVGSKGVSGDEGGKG